MPTLKKKTDNKKDYLLIGCCQSGVFENDKIF